MKKRWTREPIFWLVAATAALLLVRLASAVLDFIAQLLGASHVHP
jgi:hypothetical protein